MGLNTKLSKTLKYMIMMTPFLIISCATLESLSKNDEEDADIDVLILVSSDVNPDIFNRPSPIRIDLFQLVDTKEFILTEYLELIEKDNTLKDQLKSSSQYIVHPNSLKYINLEVDKDTKYLGVTAGFREIANTQWKLSLIKQPAGWGQSSSNYLYLKVDNTGIKQLSKKEMKLELKEYAKTHPDDHMVTKYGNFKKPKYDYSKGIFNEQK